MGMRAEIIAIGPFDERIYDMLEYDGSIPEGGETVITVFMCNTSSQSRELADGCHLKNPLQNTKVEYINFGFVSGSGETKEAQLTYEILKRFGFKFYYIANG